MYVISFTPPANTVTIQVWLEMNYSYNQDGRITQNANPKRNPLVLIDERLVYFSKILVLTIRKHFNISGLFNFYLFIPTSTVTFWPLYPAL